MDPRYRLRTVQAACELVDFFSNSPMNELGVSELAEGLHFSKTAVYRLLQNLIEFGYIQENANTRKYRFGVKFLLMGKVVCERIDLARESESVLELLRDQTGETVHLNVVTPKGPVCIAERQTSHQLRFFTRVGMILPWHAGSAGKVLLAFSPEPFQEQILAGGDLVAYTQNTVTDSRALRTELASIKAKGYAMSNAEVYLGAWAVAAPIRNGGGAVEACVSVVGPRDRMEGREAEAALLVTTSAQTISSRLGFVPVVPPTPRSANGAPTRT
jgi:IclR family KDG regulon transcriptional repressor